MAETPKGLVAVASSNGRHRGRPRAPVPRTTLSSYVDVTTYDELLARAKQRDESISSLVRQFVVIQLKGGT